MMKQEQVRRLLVRAERARKHLMQPHFTRIGLTFGQGHARILDVLLARDHITQKELSDLCHMDVTTMSRSLDRLEESGLPGKGKGSGMPQILSDMPHRRWCRRGPQGTQGAGDGG
mgnify:CR=1 FL=1